MEKLMAALSWILVFYLFYILMDGWLSTPIVQIDAYTSECVQVLPAEAGDCKHLPGKYFTQVVAP